MSIIESLKVSLYGMSVVFIVLIVLCFFVKIQSLLFSYFTKMRKVVPQEDNLQEKSTDAVAEGTASYGELKLIDVEESTAALIMAIVSDESKIPLSQLQFKSIKAIN